MLKLAENLSEPFKYVRVDFYLVNNELYVDELTLTPMGGIARYEPQEWDRILGDMIK